METIFKEKLKEIRQEKKYTQKQVAEFLNISTTCYAGYEQGYREPDFITLKRICNLFDVKSDYLLGLEDEAGTKIQNNIFDNHGNVTFNQR